MDDSRDDNDDDDDDDDGKEEEEQEQEEELIPVFSCLLVLCNHETQVSLRKESPFSQNTNNRMTRVLSWTHMMLLMTALCDL